MITILSRIVHYGFQNFWRNGWPSAATVAIMVISLSVFLGLIFFNYITDQAVTSIQDKIDISVYFKTNTPEDQILNIKESLESLTEVRQVEYISRDKALEIFRARHADDVVIQQAINELSENPLEASLNIKAQNPNQYASIAEYLQSPNLSQYFGKVTYFENQIVIDRLVKIIDNVNKGGFVATLVLAFVAGLVVFNTVRLAIYSNRDEISIMRAVGASNSLVRGPFVIEGIIAGVISAVLSLIFMAPAIYFVTPYFNIFIPGMDLFRYFYTSLPLFFLYQLAFGVGIGSFSGFVAVRRYLRN